LRTLGAGPESGGHEGSRVPHAADPGAPGPQGPHPPLQDGQVTGIDFLICRGADLVHIGRNSHQTSVDIGYNGIIIKISYQ